MLDEVGSGLTVLSDEFDQSDPGVGLVAGSLHKHAPVLYVQKLVLGTAKQVASIVVHGQPHPLASRYLCPNNCRVWGFWLSQEIIT